MDAIEDYAWAIVYKHKVETMQCQIRLDLVRETAQAFRD